VERERRRGLDDEQDAQHEPDGRREMVVALGTAREKSRPHPHDSGIVAAPR
jgi:hypothetical protein